MTGRLEFTNGEKEETLALYQKIREQIAASLIPGDEERMRHLIMNSIESRQVNRNVFGLNPILLSFQTAQLVVDEIGLRRDGVLLTSSMRHPKCLTSFSKSKSGCIIFCSSVRNSVLLAVPATPSVLMSMLMMVLAMSITLSTLSPIPLSLMIRSSSL